MRVTGGSLTRSVSFERALELRPDDGRLLGDRGEALRLMGRFDEAQAVLQRAAAALPDSAHILASLGAVKARLDDVRGALAVIDRAVSLDPGNSFALLMRAAVRRQMQMLPEAAEDTRTIAREGTDARECRAPIWGPSFWNRTASRKRWSSSIKH